jgi:hypothetical protein
VVSTKHTLLVSTRNGFIPLEFQLSQPWMGGKREETVHKYMASILLYGYGVRLGSASFPARRAAVITVYILYLAGRLHHLCAVNEDSEDGTER